jgi:glucuronosyltransferase
MTATSVAGFLLLSCVLLLSYVNCANILYLHGIISPSHHLWNRILARELAGRGHNVTFLSVDKPIGKTDNLHYIVFEDAYEIFHKNNDDGEEFDIMKFSEMINNNKILYGTRALTEYAINVCDSIYKTPSGLNKILSYPADFKFDLVINDFTFGPCLLPIIHKFNYPSTIGVSAFLNPSYTDITIGGHKYPAYVPHFVANLPQLMTFTERVYNLLLYTFEKL